MSREDVEFVLPNLADLRVALSHEADALFLLSAFDAASLASARQALRRVTTDWATPNSPLGTVGAPADEAGA